MTDTDEKAPWRTDCTACVHYYGGYCYVDMLPAWVNYGKAVEYCGEFEKKDTEKQ